MLLGLASFGTMPLIGTAPERGGEQLHAQFQLTVLFRRADLAPAGCIIDDIRTLFTHH
jgi:hypothetical protein